MFRRLGNSIHSGFERLSTLGCGKRRIKPISAEPGLALDSTHAGRVIS